MLRQSLNLLERYWRFVLYMQFWDAWTCLTTPNKNHMKKTLLLQYQHNHPVCFRDIRKFFFSCVLDISRSFWPHPNKIILSICRFQRCLTKCEKSMQLLSWLQRFVLYLLFRHAQASLITLKLNDITNF